MNSRGGTEKLHKQLWLDGTAPIAITCAGMAIAWVASTLYATYVPKQTVQGSGNPLGPNFFYAELYMRQVIVGVGGPGTSDLWQGLAGIAFLERLADRIRPSS